MSETISHQGGIPVSYHKPHVHSHKPSVTRFLEDMNRAREVHQKHIDSVSNKPHGGAVSHIV